MKRPSCSVALGVEEKTKVLSHNLYMNRIQLQGWIEQEPEIRYFGYDHVSATLRLRTEEHLPTPHDPERIVSLWHRIKAWGALAERIDREIHEGYEVRLVGRIAYHRETDRQGFTQTITEIDCQALEIVSEHRPEPKEKEQTPTPELDWSAFAPQPDEDPMA